MLHVGDFGIWPDPSRIDKATRHHDSGATFRRGSHRTALRRGRLFSSRAITRISCGSMHVRTGKCYPA
jgi:hypothetical protein